MFNPQHQQQFWIWGLLLDLLSSSWGPGGTEAPTSDLSAQDLFRQAYEHR